MLTITLTVQYFHNLINWLCSVNRPDTWLLWLTDTSWWVRGLRRNGLTTLPTFIYNLQMWTAHAGMSSNNSSLAITSIQRFVIPLGSKKFQLHSLSSPILWWLTIYTELLCIDCKSRTQGSLKIRIVYRKSMALILWTAQDIYYCWTKDHWAMHQLLHTITMQNIWT